LFVNEWLDILDHQCPFKKKLYPITQERSPVSKILHSYRLLFRRFSFTL